MKFLKESPQMLIIIVGVLIFIFFKKLIFVFLGLVVLIMGCMQMLKIRRFKTTGYEGIGTVVGFIGGDNQGNSATPQVSYVTNDGTMLENYPFYMVENSFLFHDDWRKKVGHEIAIIIDKTDPNKFAIKYKKGYDTRNAKSYIAFGTIFLIFGIYAAIALDF